MSVSDWLSLTLVCILGASSPGPSLAVVLTATRIEGRRGGLAAAIGHGLGVFLYAFIAAASLSYIVTNHLGLFYLVQSVGALVLIWMGARILIAMHGSAPKTPSDQSRAALTRSFRDGFLIAIFNPKIAAFFASLFSLYLADGQSVMLHFGMAALAGGIDMIVYILFVIVTSAWTAKIAFVRYACLNDLLLGGLLCLLGGVLFLQNLFHLF